MSDRMRSLSIGEFLDLSPDNPEIANAFAKMQQHLDRCDKAQVSISGGADSDVMLDLVLRADKDRKASFVFFNTGIEYEATKRHLKYLEIKYGTEIKEIKAKVPVPVACRKYGQPFLSKSISKKIQELQRHGFKWEDKPCLELLEKYCNELTENEAFKNGELKRGVCEKYGRYWRGCANAILWWCNENGDKSRFNIEYTSFLKEFMIENPPGFAISKECCECSKKNVAKEAVKADECDLVMVGVRKAEGGIRSTSYSSCFSDATPKTVAQFRPLFWFTNTDKEEYEEIFGVTHSDCYTVYGLDRTGCVGCPFGQNFEFELEVTKQNEPKLYKAVNKIFGDSYEYTRRYYEYRKNKTEENADFLQLSLFSGGEDYVS